MTLLDQFTFEEAYEPCQLLDQDEKNGQDITFYVKLTNLIILFFLKKRDFHVKNVIF